MYIHGALKNYAILRDNQWKYEIKEKQLFDHLAKTTLKDNILSTRQIEQQFF